MKKLQNDFTTPEQSKRLLELGVPANSANCYYDGLKILRVRSEAWMLEPNFFKKYSYFTPCWSVGRMIQVYFISKGVDLLSLQFKKFQIENSADYLAALIEENIKDLDFSKLEEFV